jgi:hypothetical protein
VSGDGTLGSRSQASESGVEGPPDTEERLQQERALQERIQAERVPYPLPAKLFRDAFWAISALADRGGGKFDSLTGYYVGQRVRAYLSIESMPTSYRLETADEIKVAVRPMAQFDAAENLGDNVGTDVFLTLILVGPILGLALEWGHLLGELKPLLLLVALSLATVAGGMAAGAGIVFAFNKIQGVLVLAFAAGALLIGNIAAVYILGTQQTSHVAIELVRAGLFGTLAIVVEICVYAGILAPLKILGQGRHPESDLIDNLIRVLTLVDARPLTASDMNTRQQVIEHLERIAVILQWSLPRRLRIEDAPTRGWFRGVARDWACGIRQLIREALVPGLDSQNNVALGLQKLLGSVVSGNWAAVPSFSDATTSEQSTIWSGLRRAAGVMWGVVPIAVFAAWQATPRALTGPYASAGWGLTILWALVSLAALDPEFDRKIGPFTSLAVRKP